MSGRERWAEEFGPFDGRIWLDCAHQGPIPQAAAEAASSAIGWKTAPHRMKDRSFTEVPERLRRALARLIDAPPEEVILGNSTSYGIHLLANGIPWSAGDEVLLIDGDFPASILPWLGLSDRGVRVRSLRPSGLTPTAEEVDSHLGPRTRVFCASWVNSFTGAAVDLDSIGRRCRERGVRFVVNGSQALGARSLSVRAAPIDALACCGFKWLCGPYGTGFCWVRSELLERLEFNQLYWLAMQGDRSLSQMRDYEVRSDLGNRRYDVFCPASFLNAVPWTVSIERLCTWGLGRIERYDQDLVSRLVEGLDRDRYRLLSPEAGRARSTLVCLSHRHVARNESLHEALRSEGIDVSLREGALRVSPHLYNTRDEIDRLLQTLDRL